MSDLLLAGRGAFLLADVETGGVELANVASGDAVLADSEAVLDADAGRAILAGVESGTVITPGVRRMTVEFIPRWGSGEENCPLF